MKGWSITQLTFGSDEAQFHAHSYYDIPVMDEDGARIIAYRTRFSGRHPETTDAVEIGLVKTDKPGTWQPLGTSTAWSWQQGPMAQFVPERDAVIWNDRQDESFVARMHDLGTAHTVTLPMPVYALAPDGAFALSLNMARLNTLRPGYGYATSAQETLTRIPEDDGVWRIALDGSGADLILPLSRAVAFLKSQLSLRARLHHWRAEYHYWLNHVKLSPDGQRFTIKLRWRHPKGGWNGKMGVSLTCGAEGTDLRLLDHATSHVIWQGNDQLYYFSETRGQVLLVDDTAPHGTVATQIGKEIISANVHLRHVPPAVVPPQMFLFDTPYAEEIDLFTLQQGAAEAEKIARFTGHKPERGPFRCDLHPVPNLKGDKVIVTSVQDGGRQLYLLQKQR